LNYFAYTTPRGKLLPSTIRSKEGDAFDALTKTDAKYRHKDYARTCKLVRVTVLVQDQEAPEKLKRLCDQ